MEAWLRRSGSCGRYQVLHILLSQAPRFVTAWATFLMILGGYDPGWHCSTQSRPYTTYSTYTTTAATTSTTIDFPSDANLAFFVTASNRTSLQDLLRQNEKPDDNNELNQLSAGLNENEMFNETCEVIDDCQSVHFNPESVTIVTEFQLICDKAWVVKLMIMMRGIGGFFGSFVAGQIGELYGRKTGLYSFIFIVSVSTGLAILSPHWAVYAACTFFINFGCQGVIGLANVFSMELLNSKWRGLFGGIPVWPLSLLMFTSTINLLKNWVHLHAVTSVLALMACTGFLVLPESPRWLMVNGKTEEFKKCMKKIARFNRKPIPSFVGDEFQCMNPADSNRRKIHNYLDLFRNGQLRIYSLKLLPLMTLYSLGYAGLSFGIQSLPGDFYINIILSSCCDIVLLFSASILANKIGRRWTGVLLATIGVLCCLSIVAVYLIHENPHHHSTFIKFSAFIAKSSVHGIFIVGQIFVIELFPTEVRNLATGLSRCAACVGALLAPFIIPSPSRQSFIINFSILCAGFLIHFAIFLSLPETNKKTLVETLPEERKASDVVDMDSPDGPYTDANTDRNATTLTITNSRL